MDYETFFAFDLRSGNVVEHPHKIDLGEYRIRYTPYDNGNWATVGDGPHHTLWVQAEHWDRLLKIIKDEELDKSSRDMIIDGWLDLGFPNKRCKKTFVSTVKSGTIKPIREYLPQTQKIETNSS